MAVLQKHALVMGNTWGLLIPLTILMASLRHKRKGWWFQLHRALATLSLILVVIGVILGRRLRISHPPVTVAGKCHKVMGYSALAFIVVQVSCQQHVASAHLACTYTLQGVCSCTSSKVPVLAEPHMSASFFTLRKMLSMLAGLYCSQSCLTNSCTVVCPTQKHHPLQLYDQMHMY